jgi:NAD(P)-dependent dehydrogenase (short-subunit alcohol dehydrogenase family)
LEHAGIAADLTTLGRCDPYDDVSPIVVFLASDDSHWMTGQNLHADGGVWIGA